VAVTGGVQVAVGHGVTVGVAAGELKASFDMSRVGLGSGVQVGVANGLLGWAGCVSGGVEIAGGNGVAVIGGAGVKVEVGATPGACTDVGRASMVMGVP